LVQTTNIPRLTQFGQFSHNAEKPYTWLCGFQGYTGKPSLNKLDSYTLFLSAPGVENYDIPK